MRDICRVISFLLKEVIPEGEPIRPSLLEIGKEATYYPPEVQRPFWGRLMESCSRHLGEEMNSSWKDRVGRIMRGEEVIPDQDQTEMGLDLDSLARSGT